MELARTPVSISNADLSEDRFSRFGLIDWWDQSKLRSAKILVVGAGAIGNEILKNLALLGIGHVIVIDLDSIEISNLSRSVLFRPSDVGRPKADVAAERTRDLYPECKVKAISGNVRHDLGLGVFRWADVILGALDNREARLWINRAAWKMNRPWIDGAIEGINGVARVFLPGKPPCYECTLGEVDWKILDRRMSCKLLTREEIQGGKTPTTPTTSSVIAGIQVQEAVKLLHGLPVLAGKGFVFEGMNHTSYVVEYTPHEECMSHEVYDHTTYWPKPSNKTTVAELHAFAQQELAATDVSLDFSRDVIQALKCPKCGLSRDIYACAGTVTVDEGKCSVDGEAMEVAAIHGFGGKETYGNRTVAGMGLPPYDVFVARSRDREMRILMDADRATVLAGLD
ncbi:MAG: ThiF family adenylyltransferase [Planctomycetes bacterium]|nr:ThiF family adenylyltransferase [Planctomycetota bacterium]